MAGLDVAIYGRFSRVRRGHEYENAEIQKRKARGGLAIFSSQRNREGLCQREEGQVAHGWADHRTGTNESGQHPTRGWRHRTRERAGESKGNRLSDAHSHAASRFIAKGELKRVSLRNSVEHAADGEWGCSIDFGVTRRCQTARQ